MLVHSRYANVKYINPVIAGRCAGKSGQTRTDPHETVRRGGRDGGAYGWMRFRGCRHRRSIRHEICAEGRTDVTFRGFRLLTAWAKRGTETMACALVHGVSRYHRMFFFTARMSDPPTWSRFFPEDRETVDVIFKLSFVRKKSG